MPQTNSQVNYTGNGYYESVAYDLYGYYGNAVPQEAVETAAERAAKEREAQRERQRASERAELIKRAKEAQSVSIAAVAGYAIVAVMMVFILLSYIKLTQVSTEVSNLKTQITALQKEEKELSVKYEQTFNINSVAEYATGTLGMTKLTEENTHVLRMEHDDKAEILAKDDSAGLGIVRAAREFISSLTEYLG